MSLLDELAEADIDLNEITLGDLGIDISALGYWEDKEGNYMEIVKEEDKHSLNKEESDWLYTVLDSCRVGDIHCSNYQVTQHP